jgi:pyridoxal phosphate enzyme (YggS family)
VNQNYLQIKDRYHQVEERIKSAARSVNRDPEETCLMVVTKGHSLKAVQAVINAGAKIIGENYLEEAVPKIEATADHAVEWHMIGHIQSRKARDVCNYFACVHSLDRRKIADRLDRFSGRLKIKMPVLLECNVSGEDSKYGYPVWNRESWPEFSKEVSAILEHPNLDIKGLMTMPPWNPDPEASRPYYQYLLQLRNFLRDKFPEKKWKELSIGMSNDFEVAIQEGATIVRIGTAILGPRE